MKHFSKPTIVALLSGIIFLSCSDLFVWNGDPKDPPNVLNPKDSLAIRAILDDNGLNTLDVHNAIFLEQSAVKEITLGSVGLKRFIFTKYIDSLYSRPSVILSKNEIDTLIFADTIHRGLSLSLDNNNLRSIPDEIVKLKGQLILYLNYNQITRLSPNIMKCDVYYLSIRNNKLTNVSDSMAVWILNKNYHDSLWTQYQN